MGTELAAQLLAEVLGAGPLLDAFNGHLLGTLAVGSAPGMEAAPISRLPLLTCLAVGGEAARAAPVAAAWQLLHFAAKRLDDVQDGDEVDPLSEAIPVAIGLLSVAFLALERLDGVLAPARHAALRRALHGALLRACVGQFADGALSSEGAEPPDAEAWLAVAQAKSGEPLAWAAWAGAWVGGATEAQAEAFRTYGLHLGILLQVADDWASVWNSQAPSDLATERPTLAVCYARTVLPEAEWNGLAARLRRARQGDAVAEAEARVHLTETGAQAYLLMVGQVQHRMAEGALAQAGCAPPATAPLRALLDDVFPNLRHLKGRA